MEQTLAVLNEIVEAGVVKRYALGRAAALMFYTEPMLTYDLDVFCLFDDVPPPALLSLAPIYDALRGRGWEADGEHVVVAGVPVQFLPAYNDLLIEAVDQAEEHHVKGVPTRVLRYEHLIAVMVATGRGKDRARLLQALDERPAEEERLQDVLERHGLTARYRQWRGPS